MWLFASNFATAAPERATHCVGSANRAGYAMSAYPDIEPSN